MKTRIEIRNRLYRLLSLPMLAILIVFTSNASLARSVAYFEITLLHHDNKETFVIKLDDSDKIEHARRILSGVPDVEQNIMGKIIQRKAPYNPQWSYHLEPSSIKFVEICEEQIESTAANLEEQITSTGETATNKDMWCPYPCKVTKEISIDIHDQL